MLEIGFGLLLYKFLMWIVLPLFALPFVVNCFNGKGYFHNFKVIWTGFFHFLSFGFAKRSKE